LPAAGDKFSNERFKRFPRFNIYVVKEKPNGYDPKGQNQISLNTGFMQLIAGQDIQSRNFVLPSHESSMPVTEQL
jgi:hypothetical protein